MLGESARYRLLGQYSSFGHVSRTTAILSPSQGSQTPSESADEAISEEPVEQPLGDRPKDGPALGEKSLGGYVVFGKFSGDTMSQNPGFPQSAAAYIISRGF